MRALRVQQVHREQVCCLVRFVRDTPMVMVEGDGIIYWLSTKLINRYTSTVTTDGRSLENNRVKARTAYR